MTQYSGHMETNNEIEPIEIFSGTIWEAEMVKSLLENADIEAFFKDAIMGTIAPWYSAPGGAGSVKVIVSNLDFDKAKLIVEDYEKNMRTDN
jgi:hypothetical protein